MFTDNVRPRLLISGSAVQSHADFLGRILIQLLVNPHTADAFNRAFTQSHNDCSRICIGYCGRFYTAALAGALGFPVLMGRKVIIINNVTADARCSKQLHYSAAIFSRADGKIADFIRPADDVCRLK